MSYNSLFGLGTHSPDADLVGLWNCQDNAASTTLTDDSGLGRDGVCTANTSTMSTTGPTAWLPLGIDWFTSASNYATVAYDAAMNSSALSVGGWMWRNSSTQAMASRYLTVGNQRSWWAEVAYGSLPSRVVTDGTSGTITTVTPGITTDSYQQWTNLAFVSDGANAFGYVNGSSSASVASAVPYSGTADLAIAKQYLPSGSNGSLKMAGFWMFTRDLAVTELDEARLGPEPLNLTAPAVSGTHETGELLTATDGTWDSQANGTVTYTYQWQTATDAVGTGLTDIRGATASTWKLRSAQSGLYVRCLVSASNDGGVDTAEDTGSAWTLASGNALPSYNETFGLGTHDADAALEGWWKMDDNAASTVVTDYSGNGRHGTATANTNTLTAATNYGPIPNGLVSGTYTLTNATILTSNTEVTFGGRFEATALSMSGQNFMKNGGANVVRLRVYSNTLFLQNYAAQSNEPYTATTNTPTSAIAAIDNVSTTTTQYAMVNGNTPVDPETPSGLGPYRLLIERVPDTIYYDMFCFSRYLAVAESQEVEAGPEPLNLTAPAVSGTHETGETLTTTDGTWDSQANGTVTYVRQWQRADDASGTNAANISGATASTYTLTASDENKYVRFTIASSNDGGNDAAEDQGTAWVQSTAGGGGPTFQPAWAFQATTVAL